LVVGFSVHDLAVARSLARSGVTVYSVSDVQHPPLAQVYTRYTHVFFRAGLNTDALANHLFEIANLIGSREKIVLFPTSDRIARGIAAAWPALSERYELSWAHCRDLVLRLQRKDALPEYCEAAGILYPKSRIVTEAARVAEVLEGLEYPVVVKPAQPLSSFKALRMTSLAEVQQCCARYPRDLPFVVQEWIEGPEPSLYACTSYLVRGKPLFTFTSRKIDAAPRGLGQGTVFETIDAPEIESIARTFLAQLDLSGPVAVEFKRDHSGRYWFIEPNVGRTEYCVDLAIQAGFNLPFIEYLDVTGRREEISLPAQARDCAWFDTDKDFSCFVRNLGVLRIGSRERRKAIFPFIGHGDWRPLIGSIVRRPRVLFGSMARLLARPFRPRPAAS
jgi:predicted ATP-grasp superfamily ATP-dependent carboligase